MLRHRECWNGQWIMVSIRYAVLLLRFAFDKSSSDLCICELTMAIQIADEIVVLVFDHNRSWKSFHFLELFCWNFPVYRLLADRTLEPF